MASKPNPVRASLQVHELLDRLHRTSEEQEAQIRPGHSKFTSTDTLGDSKDSTPASAQPDFRASMSDKFIALDQDKCQFMYQLMRSKGAMIAIEAGTSFGVSTIYLALAVAQNGAASGQHGWVIATEHEPSKAAQARKYWAQCGSEVEDQIDLRVGDLLETLKTGVAGVDLLLLDSTCNPNQSLLLIH
jgi:predicted O-methyltransferase YrrM